MELDEAQTYFPSEVVNVNRSGLRDGKSPLLLLTFWNDQRPEFVLVDRELLPVTPYEVIPIQFRSCSLLGHTTKQCHVSLICKICGGPLHGVCTTSQPHQKLTIISPGFPKPNFAITHVKRCFELPLPTTSSPSTARDFFSTSSEMSKYQRRTSRQFHSRRWSVTP
ncbi:hypothetical protein SK128_026487 [Halocaridina rubra]|uniref:Uncharacterized protein n=1 Tax=Halocaridina rubra TaxID=373956 RepID=A0AAN8X5K1_HALRR